VSPMEPAAEAAVPRVNSIVELLEADNPALLAELRARYPGQADMLRKGLVLGVAPPLDASIHIYCDLCREGLSAGERQLSVLLHELPRRLTRAKKLRLLAGLATSLTSAGVMSAVFSGFPMLAKIASVIAFAAAAANLLAHYSETPVAGGHGSLADSLDELVRIEGQLRDARARLSVAEQGGRETCRQLAHVVNDLAARIRRRQLFSGID
jgi:hypothetical protein